MLPETLGQVTNLTSDWTTLAVQGPKSRDTVRKRTNVDLDALYSPTRLRGLAMAYVTVAHAIAGAPIRVKATQGKASARDGVVSLVPSTTR